MRVNGRVAVVSGASRGIGQAIAERLSEEGARVYGGDLEFDDSSEVERHLDVTDLASWERLRQHVAEREAHVDILVNNAGVVGSYGSITDVSLEDWDRIVAVNQTGVFYGMRTFIPHLSDADSGAIVNISSIWGIVGTAGVAAYQASKGAVVTMTKNAAVTYAGAGIRANSVHPGLITTPMTINQDQAINATLTAATPLGREGAPREIAHAVLFLASDEASFITGQQLVVDGGFVVP